MQHCNFISASMQQTKINNGCPKSRTKITTAIAVTALICFSNNIFAKEMENNIKGETH